MSIEITICNRQRAATVDLAWMQDMCRRILEAVCHNLTQRKAPQFGVKEVKQLELRGQLSLVLVSNRQIKKLNQQWRDKNQPTDVLSFPMGLESPPPGLPWEIGEIVISMERAAEQAKEYGHTIERELAFLFAHGVLHILGFDHENPKDEKEMFGRQGEILDSAGFKR